MNINQLFYFIDVSKTKSITRTAEKYFISQQAVSDAIKKLENEFNVKLTNRIKKGVELTEDGLYFLNTAEKIIELYNNMQSKFNQQNDTSHLFLSGNLNVAVHPRCFHLGFSNFLNYFIDKYPRISLNVIESNIAHCMDLIKIEQDALGIIISDGAFPDTYRNHIIPLAAYRSYVCYSKKHPLYHNTVPCSMNLFNNYSVVTYAADHVQPNASSKCKVFFCNDISVQIDLIEQGNAIGYFTECEVKKYFSNNKQIISEDLGDEHICNLILVYSEKTVILSFINFLSKKYRTILLKLPR